LSGPFHSFFPLVAGLQLFRQIPVGRRDQHLARTLTMASTHTRFTRQAMYTRNAATRALSRRRRRVLAERTIQTAESLNWQQRTPISGLAGPVAKGADKAIDVCFGCVLFKQDPRTQAMFGYERLLGRIHRHRSVERRHIGWWNPEAVVTVADQVVGGTTRFRRN
jgi:hypothetical protein